MYHGNSLQEQERKKEGKLEGAGRGQKGLRAFGVEFLECVVYTYHRRPEIEGSRRPRAGLYRSECRGHSTNLWQRGAQWVISFITSARSISIFLFHKRLTPPYMGVLSLLKRGIIKA